MIIDYPFGLVQPHLEWFVNELEQMGVIQTPEVRHAFRAIPRHRFLSSYYVRQEPLLNWQHVTAPSVDSEPGVIDAWLRRIYCNRVCVTRLDDQHIPISSSSQPSIMAAMLEALQVEPDQRVLEIGTGTVRRIGGR